MNAPISQELQQRFSGWGSFVAVVVDEPWSRGLMSVAVQCRLGSLTEPEWALWDTGAAWSVIGPDVARAVAADLGPPGSCIALSTRFDRKVGHLRLLPLTLAAAFGPDLSVDATFLVLDGPWQGPIVLGLHGLMEHLPFALHLGAHSGAQPLLALSRAP